MEVNFFGIIVGVATFVIIGAFHPIVIKAEYHFGKRCWPAFLIAGLVCIAASLLIWNLYLSTLLAIVAFTSLWGIHELFEQEKRVHKGWYPKKK